VKKNFRIIVFWIVTPGSLVYKRRRLFETCCLILETELFYLKRKAAGFFKCRYFSSRLHCISPKTVICINYRRAKYVLAKRTEFNIPAQLLICERIQYGH